MRKLSVPIACVAALVVTGAATAGPALSRGDGKGARDNPITAVGEGASQTAVVIKYADGVGEVIYTSRPATLETAAAVLAERVAVEKRPPSDAVMATVRTTSAAGVRRASAGWGSSVCSISMGIVKSGATTVKGTVATSCTPDVSWQGVNMGLYRGAGLDADRDRCQVAVRLPDDRRNGAMARVSRARGNTICRRSSTLSPP